MQNELTPALSQAGVTDFRAGRQVAGGNINSFVSFQYSDEFPGGGPNVGEAVGQRDFERIIARGNSLVVSAEDYRYRYRADLSFTADSVFGNFADVTVAGSGDFIRLDLQFIPEPSTALLLSFGLVGLARRRRRL